ncbi:MAG: hypothetical protein JRI59_04990 [Deltaproteobacteria bacterium]|nr:hypothetical protein [Deltaproteobacteria bacterium]
MVRLNRKKVLLLCGYLAFNALVLVISLRTFYRLGSLFGMVNLNFAEVLSQLWAWLVPSPF